MSSPVPESPTDILTLGSLSKAPSSLGKEEDGEEAAAFLSPVHIIPDAIGIISTASNAVSSSTMFSGVAQAVSVASQIALIDSHRTFPGLAQVRAERSAIAQVVGRAADISKDFPPIWYVNLPTNMSDRQRRDLNERVQAMKDFKCWSSLKWWADVLKEVPTTRHHDNKMRQSSTFVLKAASDLRRFEWFRSHESSVQRSEGIVCPMSDLHARIMDLAIGTFQSLDDMSRRALEPVFKGVLDSAGDMMVDYRDQRIVLAEKHEFQRSTNSIKSSIRLISFEIGESFYDVPVGKNSRRRMVRCDVEFMQFDAEFDVARWNTFAKSIAADQKKATEDFISQQTIDMDQDENDRKRSEAIRQAIREAEEVFLEC